MNLKTITVFTILMGVILMSCRQEGNHTPEGRTTNKETEKSLIEVNKLLVEKDARLIRAYIERMNWSMEFDSAGYWYQIIERGQGKKAVEGVKINMDFAVSLLDGTTVYSSAESGPKTFKIGQGGVESGLELGVLKLQEGDSARFIFPPHLAHGLIGDGERIPARSSIVYQVRVNSLSQ